MKSISSLVKWILFVPVCLMSIGLTIFSVSAPDSFNSIFSGDRNTVARIVTFAILGLFVVSYLISIFDKKTSPAHLIRKNYFSGTLAVLTAMSMAAGAAYEVTQMVTGDNLRIMTVVNSVLAALGGIAMLYVGLNHFSGANTPKPIAILYLTLPVWCGSHLIDRFLSHTDSPVAAADTMDLVMFVALSMFFINAMMIHSLIVGKNTVNSTINFGLPAVVASIVYGLINMFSAVASPRFVVFDLLSGIVYILLGLYVLSFTIELSFKSKTVFEQVIVGEEEESEGFSDEYYSDEEESDDDSEEDVAEEISEDEDFDSDSSYNVMPCESEKSTEKIQAFEDEDDDVFEDESFYDVQDTEASDEDVADELIKDALKSDENTAEMTSEAVQENTEEIVSSTNQDDDMFFNKKNKEENKLKGPTTRETVNFEDEDFILSVNNVESPDPVYDENEDISAFILERQDKKEPNKNNRSYVERLDEIDKLIISIQGGDSDETEE